MEQIYKSAGIVIKNRKLLVEKSFGKEFFISPGGTIEEGETKEQALIRELEEEFTIKTTKFDLKYFGTYEAQAANDPTKIVVMSVYLVNNWTGAIKPSGEVEKIAWVTSDNPDKLPIGSIFKHEVIPKLKEQDLID